MRKFLLATLAGTAMLLLMLYLHGRERLKQEAKRFDELCPELPEEPPADEQAS